MHCFSVLLLFVFSYLAISTAIATEADFMLIPEEPVPVNWQEVLCKKLLQVSEMSRFLVNSVRCYCFLLFISVISLYDYVLNLNIQFII